MRRFRIGVWAALTTCAALSVCATRDLSGKEPSKRPNFVVLLADDMGYSDLGCYGSTISTPNLDRLAAGGLRFTQFYNTARCWPTRGALMTGYYAQQVRMDPPMGPFADWTRTLPQLLAPLGYRSYHSGKWHIHGDPRPCADAGFHHSYYLMDAGRNFSPQKHQLDDEMLPPVSRGSGYYTTVAIADYSIQFLKEHAARHAGEPFFLYTAFVVPHFPLHALPEDIARYKGKFDAGWPALRQSRFERQKAMGLVNCSLSATEPQIVAPSGKASDLDTLGPGEIRTAEAWESLTAEQKRFQSMKLELHAAMIDRMDQEIGRIVDQLKAMNEFENTVILFLSDNGGSAEIMIRGDGHDPGAPPGSADTHLCLGPGGSSVANTPFRRHKIWVREGGIATPLVVHWPAGISARGELRHDPGHVIDFVPTLLELAGADQAAQKLPAGAPPLPGKSLVPALAKDGAVNREYLFFHHSGNRALRMGDWKIVSAADEKDRWEPYNLATDRGETRDLAAKEPVRLRAMAERWEALQADFERTANEGLDRAKLEKKKDRGAKTKAKKGD